MVNNLSTTALLDQLSSEVRSHLLSAGRIIRYAHGQLIHARGEDKPGLSIVLSGAAQVGINGTDGVFIPVALLGVGETFGEFTIFTHLPRTHDVSAIGETEILQIPHQIFKRLSAKEPEINAALLRVSLLRNHQLLEMLDALRRLPILERTASMLLTLSATAGSLNTVTIKQDDFAYALGISRVSLGKALRELVKQELIQLGYGRIDIPEREALEVWVEKNCINTPLAWVKGSLPE